MKITHSKRPLLACALAAFAVTACGGGAGDREEKDGPKEEERALVRTAPVQERNIRRTIETQSFIEAEHRVVVLSKVAGRVVEVLVDEGQRVERGAVLARLDDREAKSAVMQAEVQLAEAQVNLDLAKLEADASTHRVGQARVERDRTQATHERNKEMGKGLIAEREIEESGYAVDAAAEALKVALFEERKAKLEVRAAENKIDDMQAKLADARIALEEHEIRAQLDGVVEARNIRGGETITNATELFVITDPTRLVSYLRRPQRELGMIRDARDVLFTTDAWPDREFRATIDVVSPVIDSENGSFSIRIRIPTADASELRPGMFVRAKILTEESRPALLVPKAAVINDATDTFVFAVRDDVATRIELDPGLEETDYLEARNRGDGGLHKGDVVVVSGHRDLRDQAKVEVAQ